ncbi:hypothetical protein [Kitasatospora sp. NPDC057223]|uniref:hypothetical protein n=1 Tax=Kitasatospora sp. NPDC057223 TaxID=3346055 RepID=UPI003630D63C
MTVGVGTTGGTGLDAEGDTDGDTEGDGDGETDGYVPTQSLLDRLLLPAVSSES